MSVWVVLQQREGRVHPVAWEAVSAALRLGEATGGGAVEALVLGSDVGDVASQVSRSGVSRVRVADDERLASYVPGVYTEALAGAVASSPPDLVVFPHTYQSVDYMAKVAHRMGAGVLSEIVGFELENGELTWRRPILEGKLQATARVAGDGPMVVSVQSGAFPAADRDRDPAPVETLDTARLAAVEPERELLGIEEIGDDIVDLSAASTIVAVGRGIGGPDKMEIIEDLARVLGAEIGASRPVIDNGWLPRDRQIGSSGQTVAPKLYVAVGISGAIQHLVGMKGAGCTVAINKDPGAPIFSVADYGIVGDLFEVVPALTEAVREARSQ